MTINFKQCNSANYCKGRSKSIKYIVIHYTSNRGDSAKNNADYFSREALKSPASAHYFVDENSIWQSVKDSDTAYHCGGARQSLYGGTYFKKCINSNSIGIEICMNDLAGKTRTKSIDNAVVLVKDLMKKYGIKSDHVIRHFDVTGKYCLPVDTTELLTPDGWKSLSEIKTGDSVMQYDRVLNSTYYASVLDVVEPHEDITYKNRDVEATADHRMLLSDLGENNFKEIRWDTALSSDKSYEIKSMYGTREVCAGNIDMRTTTVSCVTVPSGYIMIKQNGNTAIVGNCPGPMVDDENLWQEFKKKIKEDDDLTEAEVRKIVRDEYNKILKEVEKQPVSSWAANAWAAAKAAGITDGTMPRAPMTREQYVVMESRKK